MGLRFGKSELGELAMSKGWVSGGIHLSERGEGKESLSAGSLRKCKASRS